MSITSGIAIYFIIWWTVLFAVLPWGVRTQAEDDDIVPGSAPSAPSQPMLVRKLVATSVVSLVVFALVYVIVAGGLFSFDSLPFLPALPDV
ncbi:MAG: DUF1467 family protein [Pseudomonadota bacterium]